MRIAIGVDVSKGYVDIQFINQAGMVLAGGGTFDDTAAGHQLLRERIIGLKEKNADSEFIVGLESSGGLERNWLRFFREMKGFCKMEVLRLNPLAVRKFLERNLRRNKTDKISAATIAEYLLSGRRRQEVEYEPQLEGFRTLYRCINSVIGRRVEIQNELQSLLPAVQPEVVQFCRDGFPVWILELLIAYPTACRLARAKVGTLCKINNITSEKAERLIRAARQSVASQVDEQTGKTVVFLAKEIKELNEKVKSLQKVLLDSIKEDVAVKIIDSITGLGLWTSVVLRIEYGNMERFYSANAAVAYAGLDPCIEQSGDSLSNLGISRAGRKQIRNALYMPTLAAIQFNPVIRNFYKRLLAAGKPDQLAVVACMRKMIRLVYACWITGKPFDPSHQSAKKKLPNATAKMQSAAAILRSINLGAPISRREAKKRKAAAMPQKGINPLMRGPGAASNNDKPSLT